VGSDFDPKKRPQKSRGENVPANDLPSVSLPRSYECDPLRCSDPEQPNAARMS
jgi:hypothetical protein